MSETATKSQNDDTGPRGTRREKAFSLFLLVLPGLWVAVVLVLEAAVPSRIQFAPLLAAAPAIACAGTGRRSCVVLGGLCAVLALLPIGGTGTRHADGTSPGERIGTFTAILAVVVASYIVAQRRRETLRTVQRVQAISDVAQHVLLPRPPARVRDVQVAARYTSAAAGASIGGDFYEVLDTAFGARAVIGDVRGSGLDAVERAAVLLGSFREAAYDEPDLRDIARRLDVSLRRHLGDRGADPVDDLIRYLRLPAEAGAPWPELDVLTMAKQDADLEFGEDFASVAVISIGPDGRLEMVNCGHPAPQLIRAGFTAPLESDVVGLPLGLGSLAAPDAARRSMTVVPFVSGDSVLLHTDGLTKARDADGRCFDLPATLSALVDAAESAPSSDAAGATDAADVSESSEPSASDPAALASAIHAEALAHSRGRPVDDMALLVLRRV
jgi:serine phosphatase RsbU (regulator of sigma subunit)